MTPQKRLFDIIVSFTLCIILLPIISVICILILLFDGLPIFYVSERMKTSEEGFKLIKFRTMHTATEDSGVSGGNKKSRITTVGRWIRRSRLDELPQVINVLKGDISFVGPRPPLRIYVERYRDIYGEVLKNRPGVTGLASIYYNQHESNLLEKSKDANETDAIYSRRCIPRKAYIDLLYQRHQSICMDIGIMFKTVFKRLR